VIGGLLSAGGVDVGYRVDLAAALRWIGIIWSTSRSILQKEAEHYCNLYDDAFMPDMRRLT
jgi:hypothetical protein